MFLLLFFEEVKELRVIKLDFRLIRKIILRFKISFFEKKESVFVIFVIKLKRIGLKVIFFFFLMRLVSFRKGKVFELK